MRNINPQEFTHETLVEIPEDMSLDELIASVRNELPALTEEFRKSIRELDELGVASGLWGQYEVMDIVGVVAGIKPVAYLAMDYFKGFDQINEIIKGLGLRQTRFWNEDMGELGVVSKHDALNTAFVNSFFNRWSDSRAEAERRVGALLGYPPTATEAYIRRIDGDQTTNEFVPRVADVHAAFQGLVFSAENQRDEVEEYSKPLAEAMRLLTPRSYEQLISDVTTWEDS